MHPDWSRNIADGSIKTGGKPNYDRKRKEMCIRDRYKGDFHTHTRLSDGKETTWNATRKAEKDELDYYVPTEDVYKRQIL